MQGMVLTALDEAALLDNAQGWALLVRSGAYEDLKALVKEQSRLIVLIADALDQHKLAQEIIDSREPSLKVWFGEIEVVHLAVSEPDNTGKSGESGNSQGSPGQRTG